MIYITGDIHGNVDKILMIISYRNITKNDILVLLGDVGINYYLNQNEARAKQRLNDTGIQMLCIHGNHEARPDTIPSYYEKEWHGGTVYTEDAYPNLLFAKDGEIYDLEGSKAVVIGGAYSVDKEYRLAHGWHWFPDEQPAEEIKKRVEDNLDKAGWSVDAVFSHTCPYPYEPVEAFMPTIDQATVDKSTEAWLGEIQRRLDYKNWYCGHWHINKHLKIGKEKELNFLMNDVMRLPTGEIDD